MTLPANERPPIQGGPSNQLPTESYFPSLSSLLKVAAIAIGVFFILGIISLSTPVFAMAIILVVAGGTGTIVSQSKKIVETVPKVFNIVNINQPGDHTYQKPKSHSPYRDDKPLPSWARRRRSLSDPPPYSSKLQ